MSNDVETRGHGGSSSSSDDGGFSAFLAFIESPAPKAVPHNPHKTIMEGGARLVEHFLQKEDDDDKLGTIPEGDSADHVWNDEEEKKDGEVFTKQRHAEVKNSDMLAELEASMAKNKHGEDIMAKLEAAMAVSYADQTPDFAKSPNKDYNTVIREKQPKKKKQKMLWLIYTT